jgi:hypothetical protein
MPFTIDQGHEQSVFATIFGDRRLDGFYTLLPGFTATRTLYGERKLKKKKKKNCTNGQVCGFSCISKTKTCTANMTTAQFKAHNEAKRLAAAEKRKAAKAGGASNPQNKKTNLTKEYIRNLLEDSRGLAQGFKGSISYVEHLMGIDNVQKDNANYTRLAFSWIEKQLQLSKEELNQYEPVKNVNAFFSERVDFMEKAVALYELTLNSTNYQRSVANSMQTRAAELLFELENMANKILSQDIETILSSVLSDATTFTQNTNPGISDGAVT